jgi:glycosyltransferase involved in cell wall biosynthesis
VRQKKDQKLTDWGGGRRVVVHTPEPGAAAQYVAEFVSALAAQGTRMALFCPSNFSCVEEVAASGAEIVHAPVREVRQQRLWRRLYRNIVFAASASAKFWSTIRRGDIVHFQFALHLGLGLPYFFAARMKRAFVVLTVHDPLPHRWKLPQPLRWVETMLLSIEYSLCDRLVVHNQAGRRILVEQFCMDSRMVSVVPHGPLNLASTPSIAARTPDNAEPLRLLAFGTLRENKGLHLSIAAVQRLRRLPLNRQVCLTIAGGVPNAMERAYWESCKRLIQEQPAGIEVIERLIDDAEIGPLFAAHDAVLLPYVRFFSDSGVAMLALSQRRPILATGAGGLSELLHAADCGILIEAATVDAVVTSIEKARLAPTEWLVQKGFKGGDYAVSGRSWATVAERTQKVYDGLHKGSANEAVRETVTPKEAVR